MESGTWGEWVGAGATTVATVVALYFGTRDQALAEDRSAARLAIRTRASAEVLSLTGYLAGVNRGMARSAEQGHLEDDAAAAAYIADARRLGITRRFVVRRLVAAIYGRSLVLLADIDPGPDASGGLRRMILERDPQVRAWVAQQIRDEQWQPRTSSRYHRALVARVKPRRVRSLRRLFRMLASA